MMLFFHGDRVDDPPLRDDTLPTYRVCDWL